jgi:uroporphyrinogen decarboxylase
MTSRERILCALNGGVPDRVPYCEVGVSDRVVKALSGEAIDGVTGGIDEMSGRDCALELKISEILNRDVVCYHAHPPVPAERRVGGDGIPYFLDGPVKTIADLDRIELPDPEGEELWEGAESFIASSEDHATVLVTRIGISAAYLATGMETFSISLYEDPVLISALLDRYTEWTSRVVRQAGRLGFDVVWTADDLAFKTGPLLSPKMFRDQILPFARRVADSVSMPWIFHSDGDMSELLPDLVDLGVSGFNPIEPEAMDIGAVKKDWGDKLCLVGNVSVHTLAARSTAEVECEVQRLLDTVAQDGGFILASGNSLASYCKPENVRMMLDTLAERGTYPIRRG